MNPSLRIPWSSVPLTTSSHSACSCFLQPLPLVGSIVSPLSGCLLRGGRQIKRMTFLHSAPTVSCLISCGDCLHPHPRGLLAAKEVAWEDLAWLEGKMFGSLSKKGREIESDTWQGPPPGQRTREAAHTLARLFQASSSLGFWQRPEVGAPRDCAWDGRWAGRPRVMEKLKHWSWRVCCVCALMSTIEE